MAIAPMQRRMKEIGGTSDLAKGLTLAGAVGAGVLSGGNPAAISAGANLGKTVGGMSDQDKMRQEAEDAQKQGFDVVQKQPDDFDKLLSLGQAGAGAYNAMPESAPPNGVNISGDPAYMDQNAIMKRRMNALGRGY